MAARPLRAAEPEPATLAATPEVTGSASCLSVACHGRQTAIAGGTEAQQIVARAGRIWLQHDPHVRAADTINGPRYQAMLDHLTDGTTGGAQRDRLAARCASCHDPQGIATVDRKERERGIGCESCHGHAQNWLTQHYERHEDPGQVASLGQRDLQQPLAQAMACASCHVGDGHHDLNHDMLAAGHPPLRFEFASDRARLPRHWRGEPQTSVGRARQIHLWTAGQLAAASSALELLANRADRARVTRSTTDTAPWPELSEYNCLSCHQRVRGKDQPAAAEFVVRRAGGTAAWSAWHYRLALPAAERLASSPTALEEQQQWLATAMARPRHDSQQMAEIARRAMALRNELVSLGQRLPRGEAARSWELPAAEIPKRAELGLTHRAVCDLAGQAITPTADWETLCQAILALEAVRRALRPEERAEPTTVMDWREADRALRRIRASLAFGERQVGGLREPFDWPRVALPDGGGAPDEPALRDWPALLKAFDRPRELLRSLDALQ